MRYLIVNFIYIYMIIGDYNNFHLPIGLITHHIKVNWVR